MNSPALIQALEALRTYDAGSSRAALLPIDEAVVASLEDKAARQELEQRLITALKQNGSSAAREYICSKLTLIGSAAAAPALVELLRVPESADAARNALEAIPGGKATKALRDTLPNVNGVQKIGVIHSLGARRDAESVRALSRLLESTEPAVAGAAAAALGDIATRAAAQALQRFHTHAPEPLRSRLADAVLSCAERLLSFGKRSEASRLYELLTQPVEPAHVQLAATRGLELARPKR